MNSDGEAMASIPRDPLSTNTALAASVRAIRKLRGLRTSEIAPMMQMDKRSYERFERGSSSPSVDRLLLFARVTRSDPVALFIAGLLEEPAIAVGSANNKLSLVQGVQLRSFARQIGEGLGDLDSQTIMTSSSSMYEALTLHLQKQNAMMAEWLGAAGDDDPGAEPANSIAQTEPTPPEAPEAPREPDDAKNEAEE